MPAGWAAVVIRCERIEERVDAAELESSGSVLLRVQVSVGDAPPDVFGPVVARRSDAGQVIGAVLDRIYDALADNSAGNDIEPDGPGPGSSDSRPLGG